MKCEYILLRSHNSPYLVPLLFYLLSHFFNIHFNNVSRFILCITRSQFLSSFMMRVSVAFSSSHTCYMSKLPYTPWIDYTVVFFVGWKSVRIIRFSPPSLYLIRLSPKYSPQHPILETPQSMLFPQYAKPRRTRTHTHTHRGKSMLLCLHRYVLKN